MSDLRTRYQRVKSRIESAIQLNKRMQDSVRLIAVSKTKPVDAIRELAGMGQYTFGESYVQEAITKIEALQTLNLEWHFIGPIQSNKTKLIANAFDWIHSVDREKIAIRLNEQRDPHKAPLNICIQVNISGEQTKSGVPPEQVEALALSILKLPQLALRGLMAIPAASGDPVQQRKPFHTLAVLLGKLNEKHGWKLDTLSMGMSDDLEAAIAEGATLVRVGSDIFGAR